MTKRTTVRRLSVVILALAGVIAAALLVAALRAFPGYELHTVNARTTYRLDRWTGDVDRIGWDVQRGTLSLHRAYRVVDVLETLLESQAGSPTPGDRRDGEPQDPPIAAR
jgi:hypothetical protein